MMALKPTLDEMHTVLGPAMYSKFMRIQSELRELSQSLEDQNAPSDIVTELRSAWNDVHWAMESLTRRYKDVR